MSDLQKPNRKTSAGAKPSGIDRLPPHDIPAEQGVLGSILLSPNDCLAECIEKLTPGHEVFYDLRHQTLFKVMLEMWDSREPVDLITLRSRLNARQQLEMCGGLAYISSLPDTTPSAANLAYWVDIVLDKYLLRKTIQTCAGIVRQVFDNEGAVEEILDGAERGILEIGRSRLSKDTPDVKELVNAAITTIERLHENHGAISGVATGFADFDRMTNGLHEGEMIIIAARPSVGKTSLAMNIAEHVAMNLKLPVGVFSLEMVASQLILRMICSQARVNLRNIRDGFLAERDFSKLTRAASKIANAPLYIDDTSGLSILQARARARRMWQQHGIKLFVFDYLQLLHSTSRRAENRQQEVADISSGLKELAKELKVPVLALSQLSRELEKRGPGERPRLADLRESGSIEQDADTVGFLYQEANKDRDDEGAQDYSEAIVPIKLFIAKQRNGPIGDINLTFLKEYTRFESAAKVGAEDVPADA